MKTSVTIVFTDKNTIEIPNVTKVENDGKVLSIMTEDNKCVKFNFLYIHHYAWTWQND